jgi:hypothetical protein
MFCKALLVSVISAGVLCSVTTAEAKRSTGYHHYKYKSSYHYKRKKYAKRVKHRHIVKVAHQSVAVIPLPRPNPVTLIHPEVPMPRVAAVQMARVTNPKPEPIFFSEMVEKLIDAPSRFIRGSLICAVNVNAFLSSLGVPGTGSAMAKSFLNWGKPTEPVPGAVAVYERGGGAKGHVAVVARVEKLKKGLKVWVWNPSASKQRWVQTIYPKKAIAYRLPA